ncbi:MAG: insulinase family protein [Prevotella sp.]|nr:insulinase family protein [Prevotella sp.]
MNRYNTHTLHNGMRIIHLMQDSEVVYCGYAIKAGTRDEAQDEYGLAHFCEHTTFKGTNKRTSIQIINSLESVGGELNAFTAKEETVYYSAVLRQYFHRAVDLLTDIVFNSQYPQSEIEKEVEVVCDEIESYNDSPAELIYDEFENEFFRGQDLGHSVLGTPEGVRRFCTSDCQRFTGRLYLPSRMVFYVVGNIDFTKLVKKLERLTPAGSMNHGTSQTTPVPLIMPTASIKRMRKDTHQNHIMIGTATRSDIERWRIPLFLVNNMLGGPGMNSRLNLALRERRGLVYGVESVMTTYTDTLTWTVYFGCDAESNSRCRRLTMSELRRLRRKPLSANTLYAAKRQLKGQLALAAQNRENYAIDMAKQYLHYNKLRDDADICNRIDRVTPDDIHQLMNTILSEERLFTLIFK